MNRELLIEFVAWAKSFIVGDEKGQAQIFLDRLFRAFGHPGYLEVGGQTEFRIRRAVEDGGGTAFADFVWKPIVLIEMKKRGAELRKHYRQAFDYWIRLVPNRPRYVVLCNFDQFQIYDFETQIDSPVDTVSLAELPDRFGSLNFLAPDNPAPVFNDNRIAVTRQAADRLAACFNHIVARGENRDSAQKFILQMLLSLFAEDIALLPKYFVTQLIHECKNPQDSYDLIGGLFRAMNTYPPVSGGRFKGVPYFNGGLFANPTCIELVTDELDLLRLASQEDWSRVQPEIFGTLFQHSMNVKDRHAFGAHFTHPTDIMKIVGPTIVEPWLEQIEAAGTLRRLHELLDRLHHFRVLDPACGSGNFLYIAYRELKRLEARLFERIDEYKSQAGLGGRLSFFSAQNFFGIDILPFAVEIAKVTMMIARKLAVDEIHITENTLPLDNLEANFIAADALLTSEGIPANWPQADVIIGNPPYLGAKRLKPEHGPDYVNKLRRAYPEVPGMSDYCVYWFRKAHDLLPPCTAADPMAGRAGLVGTQNIRNNQSRVGGLDHIVESGTVVEAVDNQPWSGEANVHVSIVNWAKTQDPALLPKQRRLWFKAEPPAGIQPRRRGAGPAHKDYELNFRECAFINSTLSDQTDVAGAKVLECNRSPQVCFSGQVPGHPAFILKPPEARVFLAADARNSTVVLPMLIGRDMLLGNGQPSRYVIDFQNIDVLVASSYSLPFKRIEEKVLPERKRKAELGRAANGEPRPHHQLFLRYWWRHSFDRASDMIPCISKLMRYIVCSDTTKRPVFAFVSPSIRPDHKLRVFAFEDDYSFGILQSGAHWLWFTVKCSKLKSDFNYTATSVFDTFPWPHAPSEAQVEAVAEAGREIRRIRTEALTKIKGGLRALYHLLEFPGANPLKSAHQALDAAVLAAYGFDPRQDLLSQLLALNQVVASRIKDGLPVTAPGIPDGYPDSTRLVTADCIQARYNS